MDYLDLMDLMDFYLKQIKIHFGRSIIHFEKQNGLWKQNNAVIENAYIIIFDYVRCCDGYLINGNKLIIWINPND